MPPVNRLLDWATDHTSIISVVGALVIFFSWVVTNTLGQRYSRVKTATESAQSTFRLYTTLHEQRNQLNSLAMEVIQRGQSGMDASIFSSGRISNPELKQARKQFSLDRLSAHQVKELMDFAAEADALSRAVGNISETSKKIQQILRELDPIYQELTMRERSAENAINSPDQPPVAVMRAVQDYSDYYRLKALPEVPTLYQRVVDAANARQREAVEQLAEAKARADRSSDLAIWLYAIGSLLALTGQTVEKVSHKNVPDSGTSPTRTGMAPAAPAHHQGK